MWRGRVLSAHIAAEQSEPMTQMPEVDEAKAQVQPIIESLGSEQACDAVILGCTELPLVVTPESSSLPTLDSTRLLARAALKRAAGVA